MNLPIWVVILVRHAHGEFLVEVEAGFHGKHVLVVGKQLGLGLVILVGDCVEVGKSQVEEVEVEAGLQ